MKGKDVQAEVKALCIAIKDIKSAADRKKATPKLTVIQGSRGRQQSLRAALTLQEGEALAWLRTVYDNGEKRDAINSQVCFRLVVNLTIA